MSFMSRSPYLAVFVATLALPAAARAQCDAGVDVVPPDLEGTLRDSFPADQGMDVPLNSPVRLRYWGAVPSPPVLCVHVDASSSECLPGAPAVVGDEIVWQPPGGARLEASRRYYIDYQEAAGGSNRISFVTARGPAPTPLVFGGATSAKSDAVSDQSCDPDAADITIRFDRASSGVVGISAAPWPDIDVEYVIYQTRGPGISGPRERDRARLQRSGSSSVTEAQRSFRLTGLEASGPVCFNVQALDPLGHADGNTREECVNPARGNNFEGCSTRPSRSATSPSWAVAALFATSLAWRRRRARRPRR